MYQRYSWPKKYSYAAKEWMAWNAMHRRCKYPSMDRYPQYGGRGITICLRWKSFEMFLQDVGYAPTPSHSLGRIDNDGNYELGNVSWATKNEQQRNTSRNRLLAYDGLTQTLAAWSEQTGLSRTVITQRIDTYHWTIERALTIPCRPRRH